MAASSVATNHAREGSFGYPVADELVKQIKVRGDVFAKEDKTPEELLLVHGNAPWIMFRSGVDTPVASGEGTSPATAKRCVLIGGTAEFVKVGEGQMLAPRIGINYFNRENASTDPENTRIPAYIDSEIMGYRPMAGIIGINVKSKDTWGAIMEAEVNIQVWSREEMEIVDKLFFKPGMTALLEWGHSIWVDNQGNIQKTNIGDVLASKVFFEKHTFDEIDDLVQSNREKFCGNYEACFGYITNFSYKFNDKGGYDCTVKLLSRSTVLEGLRIAKSLEKDPESTQGKQDTAYVSEYHRLFEPLIVEGAQTLTNWHRLRKRLKCWEVESVPAQNWNSFPWKGREILKDLKITLYVIDLRVKDRSGFANFFGFEDEYTHTIYITLRDLLKIIQTVNNDLSIRKENNRKFQFDLLSENEYVTFREHFSLNPFVAAVPHAPAMQGSLNLGPFLTLSPDAINQFCLKIEEGDSIVTFPDSPQDLTTDEIKGYYKILNIPVSINYFLNVIEQIVTSETEDFSIFAAINTLLEGVQKAFGNVNNFGLHYNPIDDMWSIVDRNCPELWTGNTGPGSICVSGLRTTVTNLGVNSAVSPSVADAMSIAATAPPAESGSSDGPYSMIHWNEGCVNRHLMSSLSNSESSGGSANTVYEEEKYWSALDIWYQKSPLFDFIKKVTEFYKAFNNYEETGNEDTGEYADARYQELQLHGESIFTRCVNRDARTGTTVGSLCMGVIPVKVELDMLGVSRFVVGTSFKISPGILLPKYDNWGYIVTGIENKVDSNGWKTHIRTQYFPVLTNTRVASPPVILHAGSLGGSVYHAAANSGEGTGSRIDPEEYPAYYWADMYDSISTYTYSSRKRELLGGGDLRGWELGTGETIKSRGYIVPVTLQVRKQPENIITTQTQYCHRGIKNDLISIFEEIIAETDYCSYGLGGCYVHKRLCHGWGVAIDVGNGGFRDYKTNPWFNGNCPTTLAPGTLWSTVFTRHNPDPGLSSNHKYDRYDPMYSIWAWDHPVIAIFRRHGWGWGGAYGDTMHFSLFGGH